MNFFFNAFDCLKSNFLSLFQCSPMSLLSCFSTFPFQKIYKIQKNSTLVPTMFLILIFLVSFNIVSNTFPSWLDVLYCLKKKKIMSNLVPMVFSTCFFNSPTIASCHFVIGCQHSHFLFFFPSLVIF
jgi:hypothetical protein